MNKCLVWVSVLLLLALAGCQSPQPKAVACRDQLTLIWPGPLSIPSGAVLRVALQDVSLADMPASVLATRTQAWPAGTQRQQVVLPCPDELPPPPARLALALRLEVDGELWGVNAHWIDARAVLAGQPLEVTLTPTGPARPDPSLIGGSYQRGEGHFRFRAQWDGNSWRMAERQSYGDRGAATVYWQWRDGELFSYYERGWRRGEKGLRRSRELKWSQVDGWQQWTPADDKLTRDMALESADSHSRLIAAELALRRNSGTERARFVCGGDHWAVTLFSERALWRVDGGRERQLKGRFAGDGTPGRWHGSHLDLDLAEDDCGEAGFRVRLNQPAQARGCCDARFNTEAWVRIDQLARSAAETWVQWLVKLQPDLGLCLEQRQGHVLKAWREPSGLGARLVDASGKRFDCRVEAGRARLTPAVEGLLPEQGWPVLTPLALEPPPSGCWQRQRLLDGTGQTLGWLGWPRC